jgi:ABC-type Fe3+ transport system substrate-binding protein
LLPTALRRWEIGVKTMNRRELLALGAAATVALGQAKKVFAQATPAAPEVETRGLDELYREAKAEGGRLVVYAGGDLPNGGAATEQAFKRRFPDLNIRVVVDLSKYHDARIDQQLARGRLECDVAHLQTLHDFDRWKSQGVLLAYKPLGWEAVYSQFKDPDGSFTAIAIVAFSNFVNTTLIPESEAPRDALDYIEPKLKGRLALVYPHDDDAVLYQFDRIVGAYGWDYIDKLKAQDIEWRRGTSPTRLHVAEGGKAASFTCSGPLATAPNATSRFILPRKDVFLTWPQTAAIFAEARHKAAAKLYLSWLLDKERIEASPAAWPVRRDARIPGGYEPVFNYNTDPAAFRRFMADRARVERLKFQFEHLIGRVEGPSPTGVSGLYVADA